MELLATHTGAMRMRLALVLGAVLVLGPSLPAATASPARTEAGTEAGTGARTAARIEAGHSAWVSVAVARLWLSPSSPRPVDAPATAAPVRFRTWLRALSLGPRRALSSYSDTEALLGERVVVRRVSGGWAKVVVPDQPSQKDRGGYPGWVPLRQLTATAPVRTATIAMVVSRTAWLLSDDSRAARLTEISSGTSLPVLGRVGGAVRVRTPTGAPRRILGSAVVVHRAGTAPLPPHHRVLASARAYRGLPYLWGGLSGFGLDCSGLTWLSNRLHGTVIPRDALPQSRHGRPVARSHLRRGDLLFYATRGLVHHVTMYAGHGRMIEAPHTGAVVRVDRTRSAGYSGARRY